MYYSGNLLADAFNNQTILLTNGSGIYCSSAQEDNASLESFLRGAIQGLIDFSRIILMRTGSDFDRQYPGETATQHLLYDHQNGHTPSINNIYLAGIKIVEAIVNDWDETFQEGIAPTNYIGDIFGSLGGTPDFGYVTCLLISREVLNRVSRPYHDGVKPLARRDVETRRRHWA